MSKGIDIRATVSELLFRVLLQNSVGAVLATGTTSLRLYEIQMADGTLKSYDFNDNTFKATALTTPTLAMTHRTGDNSTYNTGIWTARLATLTGFTVGNIYLVHVSNTGASPAVQVREFQFGGDQGDLVLNGNFLEVDVEQWKTGTVPAPTVTGVPKTTLVAGQILVQRNTALNDFPFTLNSSTTHQPVAGLTVTGTRSIDGGAFAPLANAVVEMANGWYSIDFAAADLNGTAIAIRMSAVGGDDRDFTIVTQA